MQPTSSAQPALGRRRTLKESTPQKPSVLSYDEVTTNGPARSIAEMPFECAATDCTTWSDGTCTSHPGTNTPQADTYDEAHREPALHDGRVACRRACERLSARAQ